MKSFPRLFKGLFPAWILMMLAGCGTQVTNTTGTLVLAVTPGNVGLTPGGGSQTLSIVASEQGSTPSTVAVAISGMQAGIVATPATLTLTPGAAQNVTLSAASSTAPGAMRLTFTGAAGSVTATTSVAVTIATASQPPAPDFSLGVTPSSATVTAGSSAGATLTVSAAPLNGFTGSVNVALSNAGQGITASPATLSLTPGTPQTVTLTAASSAMVATSNLTFTGTSGSLSHNAPVTLTVAAPVSAPPAADFSFSVTPPAATVTAGSSAGAVLTVSAAALNGFTGNIQVSLSNLGQGMTASPSTLSLVPGTPQTVTVTASSTATAGMSNATITGVAANLSHNATVALTVTNSTINARLGKPDRVLIGLGAGNAISDMNAQGIKPDIIDTYLVGVGSGSWIDWNSPTGAYLPDTAQADDAIGAIPMYTLYGMAQNGDGNLSGLSSSSFMDAYWSQARMMFQKLGAYGKPALVNLEPDFWGYVEAQAPNNDPAQLVAVVNDQPECATLSNNATGVAQCLLALGRAYAPLTLIGYPASFFGEDPPTLANFMSKIGAQNADFIVAQTSDRDAGCMEVSSPPPECSGRGSGPFYWDEANVKSPNFTESLNMWSAYRGDLPNNLPIIWWQTPMGFPSSVPGGTNQHYRDDHVDYMLKNTGQYANIGSFGIVFSSGASSQTVITTDGGQFANLFAAYLNSGGAPIP